ncbi:MAG: cytochrome-c peroxidase [Rhodospirillales bacterium]|nr:cytochrome-c peroxidase [Rhodospirillales bacterium]
MRPSLFVAMAAIGAVGVSSAYAADDLMAQAQSLFQPIPETAPTIEGVASTPAVIELGRMLYFEPRLSDSHNISCNSCHQIGLGGVDMLPTSLGHKSQRGARNAPTVLNSYYNEAQFWDGRAKDLVEQAGGPIQNPIEMAITHKHAVEMLRGIPGYADKFQAAFPGQKDPITIGNVEKAIAVFETTLITPNAPFDKFLRGDAKALTAEQKEGLRLFIDNGCAGCHNGINVGGGQYAPFGVVEKPGAEFLPPDDKGRFMVTKTPSDEYVFKVPTLRNIALTPPYFHTGKSWDLEQAVGVMGASQLGIELTSDEVVKITAFLHSLTGEQPQVVYPILPPSTAETPQPEF